MGSMNCAIIDDDNLSRKVLETYIEKTDFLDLAASYPSAVEAINDIGNKENIDIIFLDIEMPHMTGMDFLKTLNKIPQIIIVSSKEQYALEAFEYDVTDYILKPVAYSRFFKAVTKVKNRLVKTEEEGVSKDQEQIFIKSNSSLVRLSFDDILWVEALENYVVLNTFKEKYTIHFTMKAIEDNLPSNLFARIHRSYIINKTKINVIEDNAIVLKIESGNKTIPIGKSYREKLMNDLNLMTR